MELSLLSKKLKGNKILLNYEGVIMKEMFKSAVHMIIMDNNKILLQKINKKSKIMLDI